MKRALVLAVAALALTASRPAAAEEAGPAGAIDLLGRPFRVAFDPGRRMTLGLGWTFDSRDARTLPAAGPTFSTGVSFRHHVDFDDEGIVWKLDHEIGSGAIVAGREAGITGDLYRLHFLRWSDDGRIVVPSSPPRRIPFPVDIGFEAAVGSVDLRRDDGLSGEIGIARGDVLFDLMRRPDHRGYLTLGVGPRYALRLEHGRIEDQIVAPFSQPEIDARIELGHGHHVLEAKAGGGYAFSTHHGGGKQARAEASYELVVVAVNDAPISIRADASFRYDDPALPGRAPAEARGGASAVFALPLPDERTSPPSRPR